MTTPAALHSSTHDDWMTPADIVERARSVLGAIDFDPASSAEANKTIKARRFYTREDDALSKRWPVRNGCGSSLRVFMNPPGGKRDRCSDCPSSSLAAHFWRRLMLFRQDGYLQHAIVVAFSLEAFQTWQAVVPPELAPSTFPFCVPNKRVKFVRPGSKNRPSHASAIIYVPGYAHKTYRFEAAFSDLGATRV